MTQYARNDQVRAHVFLNGVGTATPDPLYTPVLGMEAITQSLGDITDEEVPSATRYQEFDIVGGIPGKKERATTSLTTRKPVGQPSIGVAWSFSMAASGRPPHRSHVRAAAFG